MYGQADAHEKTLEVGVSGRYRARGALDVSERQESSPECGAPRLRLFWLRLSPRLPPDFSLCSASICYRLQCRFEHEQRYRDSLGDELETELFLDRRIKRWAVRFVPREFEIVSAGQARFIFERTISNFPKQGGQHRHRILLRAHDGI
jgi:hypothetical protein